MAKELHELLNSPPNSRSNTTSLQVVKRLEEKIREKETPLIEKLILWQTLLEFVTAVENQLIDDPEDESLLATHKCYIDLVIVLGEHMIDEPGLSLALEPLGCNIDDFKAKVDILEISKRQWHSDMTTDHAEHLLSQVFGEQ